MTFNEFLTSHLAPLDAIGDFIRLAQADAELPHFTSWDKLRTYMLQRHGSQGIADAGEIVWKEYLRAEIKRKKLDGPSPNES